MKLVHCVLLVPFVFYACSDTHSYAGHDGDSLCGPISLKIALKAQGVFASVEELCALSGYDSITGTAMLGLYNAARKKGVAVAPVRIDLESLCKINGKSVVFVNENHFLVFCGCSRDKVKLENPSEGRLSMTKTDFQGIWNGETLLFGKAAQTAFSAMRVNMKQLSEGPHLHLISTRHAFGVVNENSVLTHSFTFRNTGSDTLRLKVRSGCGCASASLSSETIPPRVSGTIRVVFKTENRKGSTSQKIYVRTNDLSQPMISLVVSANVRETVKLVPDRLWIDTIGYGESITREVIVTDSGDGTLAIKRIKTPNGITAQIGAAKKAKDGKRAIPILFRITGNNVGKFEKNVVVYTNNRKQGILTLRIAGEIRSALSALPPTVFFGVLPPNSAAVREVVLSGWKRDKFDELRVKVTTSYVKAEFLSADHTGKYKLIVKTAGLPAGVTVRDSIKIYRRQNKQPIMSIPVFATTEE